jgi:FkbM family methyltransferase
MEQRIDQKITPIFLPDRTASIKLFLWRLLVRLQNKQVNIKGIWRLSKIKKWLIKDNEYLPISYGDLNIWISPGNIMDRNLLRGIPYEPEVVSVISKFIRAGFSYLDIGAYIGLHLVMAVSYRVNDNQQFIGVEPAPLTYKVLEKNIQSNNFNFVKTINCGLGNVNTKTDLFISSTNNKGQHSLFPSDRMKEYVEIEVKVLDDLLENFVIDSWIIKIDTEGSEISVLDGGAKLLSSIDNLAIIIEVHPENLYRAGNTVKMLVDRVRKLDCELYILDDLCPVNCEDDILTWLMKTKNQFTNILCIKGESSSSLITY